MAMLTGLSRSEANDVVASGAVSVNNKVVVKPSTTLEEGQHVEFDVAPGRKGDEAQNVRVI